MSGPLRRAAAISTLLLSCVGCFGTCDDGDGTTPAPACDHPASPGTRLATLSISSADGSRELADGDLVSIRLGGQGANMFVVTLRATGDAVPSCMAHVTTVTGDVVSARSSAALIMTPAGVENRYVSNQIYLPYDGDATTGDRVTVRVEAEGLVASRLLIATFGTDEPEDAGF